MSPVQKTYKGWAVQCQWPGEKPFLCGISFWAWEAGDAKVPNYLGACRTAVFETRAKARVACIRIGIPKNKARVVKVTINIQTMEGPTK